MWWSYSVGVSVVVGFVVVLEFALVVVVVVVMGESWGR